MMQNQLSQLTAENEARLETGNNPVTPTGKTYDLGGLTVEEVTIEPCHRAVQLAKGEPVTCDCTRCRRAADYEARRAARAERFRQRAENAKQRSDEAYQRSHDLVKHIPFGQPILVGHHSESMHRNTLKKSHAAMDRSCAEQKKAEYWEERAEAAEGNRAIFSDDPSATEKLEAKIARLEKRQELITAANKCARKNDREGLLNLGFSESQADELLAEPEYSFQKRGFQPYQLSNNSANIRRLKERLKQLESAAAAQTTEREENGVRIVDNVEENRLQLFFEDKPCDEVRAVLKRRGFRWSRRNGAWQRHRGSNAEFAAKMVLEAVAAA